MGERLVVGTRGSRLALVQTRSVAAALERAWPGLEVRIEEIHTAGDRDRSRPLSRLPGVGFFVKELQVAILEERIDLAVHSMKDVPTAPTEGLTVGAVVPARADPRDVLVTPGGAGPPDLAPGTVVGTSSPRRRAMLAAARPDLAFRDLRGNVDTRLAKLEAGVCGATVLAAAGLARLGAWDEGRMRLLETDILVPAAGQGASGLEHRAGDARVRRLIEPLDDAPSRHAVTAERALARRLEAGCRTPLGVLGRVGDDGRLALEAYLLAPDGRDRLRERLDGPAENAAALGVSLAERMLAAGARRMLEEAE